jgi:hypothetical protein
MVRICKNSFQFASIPQFQHVSHVVAVLEKKKQRTLGVKTYNIE